MAGSYSAFKRSINAYVERILETHVTSRSGDSAADQRQELEDLIRKNIRLVVFTYNRNNFFLKFYLTGIDPEDVMQESVYRIILANRYYRDLEARFSTYLSKALENNARKLLGMNQNEVKSNEKYRRPKTIRESELPRSSSGEQLRLDQLAVDRKSALVPENEDAHSHVLSVIREAVASLPLRERLIVMLRDGIDLSDSCLLPYQRAALILRMRQENVERHRSEALAQLSEALARKGEDAGGPTSYTRTRRQSELQEHSSQVQRVRNAAQQLPLRDRVILMLCDGIYTSNGDRPSLEEIGDLLGVSGAYVHQVHDKTLNELRRIIRARCRQHIEDMLE